MFFDAQQWWALSPWLLLSLLAAVGGLMWSWRWQLQARGEIRRLAQANAALEATNAARARLLAAAFHDLRQPANALSLLASGADAACARSGDLELGLRIQGIKRCADTLDEMLTHLMDASVLDNADFRPELAPVHLSSLVAEIDAHFRLEATGKGLVLALPEGDVVVMTDLHLLKRILFNLVGNALKYTDHGGVCVSWTVSERQVGLVVADTGVGIAPDKLGQVFQDFARVEPSPSRDGLGIGLAVVSRAAKVLGHRLQVQSTPGRGTSVTLLLGRAAPQQAAATEPVAAAPARSAVVRVLRPCAPPAPPARRARA